MIPRIPGWSRSERGDVVILTHPRGAHHGEVRYCERVRPVRPLAEQLAIVLATPAFGEARADEPVAFTTDEGELAGLVTVHASCHGPVVLVIGTVYGDDFQATLSASTREVGAAAELAALARGLLERDVHALGVRRRAVPHAGPPGWERDPHGLVVDWIAPTGDAVLRVEPAEPGGAEPLARYLAVSVAEGRGFDDAQGPFAVAGAGGARWEVWQLRGRDRDGRALHADVAVAHDAHYAYAVVLESLTELAHARQRAAFHAVLGSMCLRSPHRHAAAAILAAAAHWTH